MSRMVVVCDADPSLAASTCETIKRYRAGSELRVCVVPDLNSLRGDMPESSTDVLFFETRANQFREETKALLSDVMRANPAMQVVFTGVSEKNLIEVEQFTYAFLLPDVAGEQDVWHALDKAIVLHDKLLERPIVVKSRKFYRAIQPNKVSYIESDLRKIRIHTGSDVLEVYGKLSSIMAKLPTRFVQCHKSFVVNMGYVSEVTADCIVLTTGEKVPMSQKRRKNTREAFVSYVGRVC